MHFAFKRFLHAGISAALSLIMLSTPVCAVAEEAELIDHNADGVIDVFDYVLSKRVSVAENSPVDLSISDAEATAGSLVTVTASLGSNPGFDSAKFIINYDPELKPEAKGDSDEVIAQNVDLFPDLRLTTIVIKKVSQIACCSNHLSYTEENGEIFDITFRVPEDALPGTTYLLEFQDVTILNNEQRIPLLTKRGKIIVVPPEALPQPENPVEPEPAVTTTVTEETAPPETESTKTEALSEEPDETEEPAVTTGPEETTETTTTTTVSAYVVNGIDVSVYQGKIDFKKVKEESDNAFIMMRAGFGRELDQEDVNFKQNYNGAKAAGIPVGAYWYSYAPTPELARVEAHVCAQVLGNRKFEFPIAFDIEERSVLELEIDQVSAIIDAFCSEMEKMGYYVMVYCSSYYLNHRISPRITQRYDVWVANYNVERPTYTGKYGIWQYGLGTCPGIEGDVDVDYCYRDYETVIKTKHFNGY